MADVVLYQFPGAYGFESLSPFCTKVGAYLRLAAIPHRVAGGNPARAPKGKLPYLGLDGELVADSGIILERLRARFGDPLDGALAPRDHALGHLARRAAVDGRQEPRKSGQAALGEELAHGGDAG